MKTYQIISIIGVALASLWMLSILTGGKTERSLPKIIEDDAFLADVRTPEEFSEGHIKGSVNIPLDEIEDHLDKFKDQKQIVVFCRSGRRSAEAKKILEKYGITNVVNGGAWTDIKKIVENN